MALENEHQNPASSQGGDNSDANVVSSIERLTEEMQRLREDFDTKVKYDASKERLIDTLHKELQTYREGFHFKILRPVLMDLISMHDDLDRLLEDIGAKDMLSPTMMRNLRSFQESIEDILQRYEVQAFTAEGETFVSGKQRILKVVEVGDPTQDRYIARRVRKGFEYDGRMLRPEIVEIYRFNASLQIKEAEA
jgi:molecular chaperone GrpE